ncbi:MAG: hypothetical protein U9P14_12305 [Gemmatimonadota bacterium]|nr:hypothetical protein [Gemmatimonadota bacterium]
MPDRYSTQNLNRTLTQFAVENLGLGGQFVAEKLAPVVRVPTTTGSYYEFSNTEAFRDDYDALRAPKTESNEIRRSYSSKNYACQQYGLRELIADEEMDNADRSVIDPERDAMALITRKLKLAIEIRTVGKLMSTSYITNNGASTAAWNASSGVDIEGDIDTAKSSVRKNGGVEPNTIVIPPHIALAAKKDSEIRDLVKYTDSTLLVNGELPPRLFGLEVVIPMALSDEAAAGVGTPSLDFAWDDNSVLVAYVEREAPSKRSISLAYQLRRPIGGSLDVAAFRYREDGKHATVVEGLIEQTEEIVCAGCGYLITGAYS